MFKKINLAIMLCLLFIVFSFQSVYADDTNLKTPSINSRSAVVLDRTSRNYFIWKK